MMSSRTCASCPFRCLISFMAVSFPSSSCWARFCMLVMRVSSSLVVVGVGAVS